MWNLFSSLSLWETDSLSVLFDLRLYLNLRVRRTHAHSVIMAQSSRRSLVTGHSLPSHLLWAHPGQTGLHPSSPSHPQSLSQHQSLLNSASRPCPSQMDIYSNKHINTLKHKHNLHSGSPIYAHKHFLTHMRTHTDTTYATEGPPLWRPQTWYLNITLT